jgi:hypothetical protein
MVKKFPSADAAAASSSTSFSSIAESEGSARVENTSVPLFLCLFALLTGEGENIEELVEKIKAKKKK